MANRFEYESPINRLLNITIPQFVADRLDRQESRRRFDEEIALKKEEARTRQANLDRQLQFEAAERLENRRRFNLQYEQNKESFNYQKKKDEERETYDSEFTIVDQLSSIGNYDKRIKQANSIKKSGVITDPRILSKLNAVIESSSDIKNDRENILQTAFESKIIDQRTFNILSNQIGASDSSYNRSYQMMLGSELEKQSQLMKNNFEELKNYNKQITYLSGKGLEQARILEATQPGSVEAVENQLSELQAQKKSVMQMLSAGSPSLGAGEYSPQYQSAINKVFRQEDLSTEDIGTLSAEEMEDLERFMLSSRDATQAPPEEEKPQLDLTKPFELSIPTPEEAPSKMNIPSGEFAEQPLTAGRLRKIITSEFNKQRVAEARGIDVAPSQEYQFVTMLARQLGFDSAEDLNSQAGIKAIREYYR